MKKLILFFGIIGAFVTLQIKAEPVVVNVSEAGSLNQVLTEQFGDELGEIQSLILTGMINGSDIETINSLANDYVLRSVDISETSLKNISSQAFKNSMLTKLVLPKGLRTLGNECFHSSQISTLIIPTTDLKTIPQHAFTNSRIAELDIPEAVTTLGKESLVFCQELKKLTLPTTLTLIKESALLGDYAFAFTKERYIPLKEIHANMTSLPEMENAGVALGSYWDNCTLYVPKGSADMYMANKLGEGEWYGFGKIERVVEKEDNNTSIDRLDVENPIKIQTIGNKTIIISGLCVGEVFSVYSISGVLLEHLTVNSSDFIVNLPSAGVYILRTNLHSKKTIVF